MPYFIYYKLPINQVGLGFCLIGLGLAWGQGPSRAGPPPNIEKEKLDLDSYPAIQKGTSGVGLYPTIRK